MNNIAVYLRVSTNEQDTSNQLPAIMAWCEAHGYNKERIELYQENATAWKDGHQKEFARLLTDIRKGRRKFDYIVVWALDRITREGPLKILNIIHDLRNYHVKIVSIQEPFTDLPFGFDDVVYSFIAWVAKSESDRRSKRTLAGLERARGEGKQLGRPKGCKDKKQRRTSGYYERYALK